MKLLISLNLSGTSDVQICVDGKNYTTMIAASSNFKAPAVTAATAALVTEQVNSTNTALTNLSTAIAAPVSATRIDAIKTARMVADNNLTALGKLVEMIANAPTVLDINRLGIIHSAGMSERTYSSRQKQAFAVETGDIDGTVTLFAKGIDRGSHEWRYTTDSSGFTNWQIVDSTLQATTIIAGLGKGQQCAFTHRTILKDGPTAWEGPILGRAR